MHLPDEVPKLYRAAAASGGAFVNPALTEPFGLTLLEAAASGLPIVATNDGGPRDITANCHNGLLIDPLDQSGIVGQFLGQKSVNRRKFIENDRDGTILPGPNQR